MNLTCSALATFTQFSWAWQHNAVARLPNCESSVGRSKIAGVRQNEDIVAVEADLVGWGNCVRYGRGANAARYLQAGHDCGAARGCVLFYSKLNTAA